MNEKLVSEFMSLGRTNKTNALLTLQVYLELCEVKKYWEVECKYSTNLERLYLTAKKTQLDRSSIFLPYAASEELSFSKITQLLIVSEEKSNKSIYLVLVSADSTCVYYQVSHGLIEPSDTSAKHLKENKREVIDANLRKQAQVLEQSALHSLPITINTNNKGGTSKKFE